MPSLRDIPISSIPPSGRAAKAGPSRQVRWDMERAARGEESARAIVGRGIQQLGAGIGAIGEKLHNQLVGDQSLFSKIEYETGMQKFLVDVDNTKHVKDGIPQWGDILEQGNARHKELIEGISKRLVPKAKEAFQFYAQQRKLRFDEILYGKIQGIRKNFITEILPVEIGRIAHSGDWETAYNLLNEFKATILATGDIPESQLLLFDKAFDKGTVRGAIGNRLPDEYIERLIKESDSLTQDEKASLRRDAKIAIANRQREQQVALEAKQDETSIKLYLRLLDNKLTQDEVEIALENKWLRESQGRSLISSLLDPKIPKTDYLKALENVDKAIAKYRVRGDRKAKEEAIDALYANHRNIGRAEGGSLLNEIEEMSIPDSALNRPAVKDGLALIEEYKGHRISMMKKLATTDEEKAKTLEEDIKQELFLQFGTKNDFLKWILENPKASDKEIEDKLEFLTSPEKEKLAEITLHWFGRWMRPKETTPFWRYFGTTEETALARKKAKAGIVEKEGEKKILTPEIARQYLNLAGGDRKRAEELAKEAGYEW